MLGRIWHVDVCDKDGDSIDVLEDCSRPGSAVPKGKTWPRGTGDNDVKGVKPLKGIELVGF